MKVPTIINPNIEIAKQKLLEKAKQKNTDTETKETPFQGLLFVGNRHETVPLRLLTDKYLSPRAKTAWQLIKINAYQFQGSAFPSYDELALWLSDRAFQGKATSRKIVSQTLLLLRLTRWLTLCETVRNEQGQVLGNVYVMNDEPLSLMDTLHLSDDYLRLLEKSTRHRDPLVKDVAIAIIDEMLANKAQFWHFISHMSVIQQRYALLQQALPVSTPAVEIPENMSEAVALTQQKLLSSHMELSENSVELSKKMQESLSSNRELSPSSQANSLILDRVPNGNSDSVQYSTKYSKYSTVLQRLGLSSLEIGTVETSLSALPSETCEALLLEAEQRIQAGTVKRPAGYIFGLISRAQQGEFKPYYADKKTETVTKPMNTSVASRRMFSTPSIEINPNSAAVLAQLARRLQG